LISLLFLLAIVVFVIAVMSAARRSARRQAEYEDQLAREPAERGPSRGEQEPPFGASPFGSLFDMLMTGGGARSYEYDPETGRWVDVSHTRPEPDRDEEPSTERPAQRRRARRQQQPQSPLSSLFGGGMAGLDGSGTFEVERPDELTTFEDVGGMEALKREIRDTIGLMLQHPEEAERYGIDWNGILLYGPPGVGKTFFARAIAGEYGLNFIHVSTGDLVSGIQGGSARNIDKAFQTAEQNLPCLLSFDEFDSVAQRRGDTPDQESRRTVNQLLTSLEGYRDERALVVMAATNSIEHLDPAVIRPGRFDRHIRIDLPDAAARREIFLTELDDRPAADDVDLDSLVQRTEGMTPAAIEKVVDTAALDVFREATETGKRLELDTPHLLSAIERYGGQDRPTVEHWTWDSLILPPAIKAQLQQLQAVIEDPDSARRFGVDPPTGLLLAGPPGSGKTTVAKVLAAQARASFYPISGADVMSKWVGQSEQNIRQLFERARENRPSIVFIDEIDAIAGRRGESLGVHDQPRQPAAGRGRRHQRPARRLRRRRDEPARPARPCAAPRRAALPNDRPRPAGRGRPPRDAPAPHREDAHGGSRPAGARRAHGRLLAGRPQVACAGGGAGGDGAHRRQRVGAGLGDARRLRGCARPPAPRRSRSRLGDERQDAVERAGHLIGLERLDEVTRVADLAPAAAAHEAAELLVERAPVPGDLPLERPERTEVAVLGDELLDAGGAEGADELVLEVGLADVEAERLHPGAGQLRAAAGALEGTLEVALLARVHETREPDAVEAAQEASDRLRASDRHDRHAFGREVAAAPLGERLDRDPVADALDEDDGTRLHVPYLPDRMLVDEYVLDTPVVRSFVADVRAAIEDAASPEEVCEAIRPRFAELLADPDWLPHEYREAVAESGMGGGIGTWLLFRAADGSLSLVSLVVPPGAQTPIHDHLAWGLVGLYRGTQDEDVYAEREGGIELIERRALQAGDFYTLLPPRDDIHRVRTTSPETSVSIHLLTNDIGCIARHTWDPESGDRAPFRSGYVNTECEEDA
jgi:SpoVK/Ycf46/Vps4 family AAA+-type ATPase/predicted metal-dependent enzyme (double-stranded beta helix superfamily)